MKENKKPKILTLKRILFHIMFCLVMIKKKNAEMKFYLNNTITIKCTSQNNTTMKKWYQ